MRRFVVLEHDHPRGLHWDLMIESGAMLRTWALAEPPDAAGPVRAEALADHRPAYLDYEGPVSGGRGTVRRWDAGTVEVVCERAEEVLLSLSGQRLAGLAQLTLESDAVWRFAGPACHPP